MRLIDHKRLEQLKKWAGFVGVMTIISGVLSAIVGVFVFIVGAIPGIITIILGVKLNDAQKEAGQLLASEDLPDEQRMPHLNLLFDNMNSYFKIQGILIIVNLVMFIIAIIVVIAGGYSFMNSINNF